MITLLEEIKKIINEDMYLLRCMLLNKNYQEVTDRATMQTYTLGERCLWDFKMKHRKHVIGSIRERCISELKGTYYEDYESKFVGSDAEVSKSPDLIYGFLSACFDDMVEMEIEDEIIELVDWHSSLGSSLSQALSSLVPDAGPYSMDENGDMHKVSLSEEQMNEALQAGSMFANIAEYNERISKIKALVADKGNLAEIIRLTEL